MITVNTENEIEGDLSISQPVIEQLCQTVLMGEGHTTAAVTFIFSIDETLRNLKKQFFNVDEYTDVITFNLEDDGDSIEGEIYISWDRVKDNADQLQQRIDNELKRIVIHGCLHLVGYDDQTETDKNEMTLLENQYLSKASNTLIKIAS